MNQGHLAGCEVAVPTGKHTAIATAAVYWREYQYPIHQRSRFWSGMESSPLLTQRRQWHRAKFLRSSHHWFLFTTSDLPAPSSTLSTCSTHPSPPPLSHPSHPITSHLISLLSPPNPFFISSPPPPPPQGFDITEGYLDGLLVRLRDKGVSVRKTVVGIIKDVLLCQPDHPRYRWVG